MKNILITGPPGIGKTTLVKKIIENLNKLQIVCDGFYTEEVKQNGSRIGFDIITLEGKRAVLARKSQFTHNLNMPTVGQYSVHLDDFEKLALPVLEKDSTLLIIDEIGKMETFSKRFEESVRKIIENENRRTIIIATVPLKTASACVKQLKEEPYSDVILVNHNNRDLLASKIVDMLKEAN